MEMVLFYLKLTVLKLQITLLEVISSKSSSLLYPSIDFTILNFFVSRVFDLFGLGLQEPESMMRKAFPAKKKVTHFYTRSLVHLYEYK